MPHTITVNQPNMAPDAEVITEFGVVKNGGSISLSDEQVAVWKAQNPNRELPTALDHSAAEKSREAAFKELRRPADDGESEASVKTRHARADEIEQALAAQRGTDLSDTKVKITTTPPQTKFQVEKGGDQ